MTGRSGFMISEQVAKFGNIADLSTTDFSVAGNIPFQVKNESADNVTLDVIAAGDDTDTYVSTVFYPGWNPEIVKKVKMNSTSATIKWGY